MWEGEFWWDGEGEFRGLTSTNEFGNWVGIVLLINKRKIILTVQHDLPFNFPLKIPPHQIGDMNSLFNSLISLHEPNKRLKLKVYFSP
jgi:hypothetical protein